MVIAQVASEVTMLARRMDAFLKTSKPDAQVTQACASALPKGDCIPEVTMPNRMVALFRSYLRGKLCKNPLSEVKGLFKRSMRTREFFFDSCVVEGGSLALDFFKSIDPGTASAQLQMYTPSQGVSTYSIVRILFRIISVHLYLLFSGTRSPLKAFGT